MRDPLAEAVLKIPKDMLRLITPNVGGAFGMKAFVYPEQALVVWASRKLRRAVKWQEDRSEGFVSDNQGRDHSTRAELALDENGRFLGLRVSILANLGAYLSPFGCFVPTRSTELVSGLYSIEAIHINVKGVCKLRHAGYAVASRAAVGDALYVGHQAASRFWSVRGGDGPLHGSGGMVVFPRAARSKRAQ